MLDPFRAFRLLMDLRLRRSTEGVLHLVDRAGHDDPESEREHAGQNDVMDEQAKPSRDTGPPEPFDARPERRGQDESEKDESENELQLPERERHRDDRDDDQRREGYALRCLLHDQGSFAVRRKRQTQ